MSNRFLIVVICFLLVFVSNEARSGVMTDSYVVLQEDLDSLTVSPNREKLDKNLQKIDVMLKEDVNNPLTLMYKGIFTTILARDSYNIFKKKSYVNEGLSLMDSIDVSKYKNNKELYLRLLIMRGFANAQIPKSFNRSSVALGDLVVVEKAKEFNSLIAKDKTRVYVGLSKAYTMQSNDTLGLEYKNKALNLDKEFALSLLE
jgi:hypothetical protein